MIGLLKENMKTFSYTKSQSLVLELQKIEDLRRQLLLTPLSLKEKQILRWSATVNRTFYSLLLSGITIERSELVQILNPEAKKAGLYGSQELIRFKQALDRVSEDWLVNPEPLTAQDLIKIYEIIYQSRLKINTEELESSLR